jgi:hypothetical protein
VLDGDAVADAEAEPGPLADVLGGEEGVEDTGQDGLLDAAAVVRETDLHRAVAALRRHREQAGAAGGLDGGLGVEHDIEEHLLELVAVDGYLRQVVLQGGDDVDVAGAGQVLPQPQDVADDIVGVGPAAGVVVVTGEEQNVPDDGGGPLGLVVDAGQVFPVLPGDAAFQQHGTGLKCR